METLHVIIKVAYKWKVSVTYSIAYIIIDECNIGISTRSLIQRAIAQNEIQFWMNAMKFKIKFSRNTQS